MDTPRGPDPPDDLLRRIADLLSSREVTLTRQQLQELRVMRERLTKSPPPETE